MVIACGRGLDGEGSWDLDLLLASAFISVRATRTYH